MKKRYRVLIADDEYWIRENLINLLDWDNYGFQLLCAAVDGKDALEKIGKYIPDIFITDINMPFINGVDLIKQVKKKYPKLVIIGLSGYSDFEYVHDALLAGAIDYLLKPLTQINLIQVLSKAKDIISNNIIEDQKQQQVKDKLVEAKLLLQDKEFSDFLFNTVNPKEFEPYSQKMEIELNYLCYRLIVIRILCDKEEHDDVSHIIKEKVKAFFPLDKTFIISNIYQSEELILVTELDKVAIQTRIHKFMVIVSSEINYFLTISISNQYSYFKELNNAYSKTLKALMSRRYLKENSIVWVEEIEQLCIKKHLSPESENRFLFSLQSKNNSLLKEIVLKDIGFDRCETWLYFEVQQTTEHLLQLTRNELMTYESPIDMIEFERLAEALLWELEQYHCEKALDIMDKLIEISFDMMLKNQETDTIKATVVQVKEYIELNYFEELTVSKLSKIFLVESSYLSKVFKKEVNCNIMNYIAKYRIDKAKDLIVKGERTLTEIGNLVGYDDYAYFNRVFKKITGLSPRKYRNYISECMSDEN